MKALSWRAKAGVVLALVLVGYGWNQFRESVRLRTAAENTRKAEQLRAHIARQVALETPEAEVLKFLRTKHPDYVTWPSTARTDYGVPVGQEPSSVWYCESITRYVILEVEDGGLARISVGRWSNDCL